MCDFSIGAVEDLGDFLEGGTLGFDIEEENKDQFEADPDL